jgi:aminopeptidase N
MRTSLVVTVRSLALIVAAVRVLHADPYPRQPIDVQHYRFAITLSDSTDRIDGTATVRLTVLKPELAQIWLDLASITAARQGHGMRVTAVSRSGGALVFRHDADRLTITLDKALPAGTTIELVVQYAGIPADGLQIKPNPHGDRAFFSDNWPTKGHPRTIR